MGYDATTNPIVAYVQPKASGRLKQWIYLATSPVASVATDGFFSDGYARGMRKGDLVWYYNTAENEVTGRYVNGATATGGVDTTALTSAASGTSRSHREFTGPGTTTLDPDNDDIIEVLGGGTVQLTAAATRTSGRAVTIVDGDGNTVTISPAGVETIAGLSTWSINFARGAVTIIPNFAEDEWLVI